MRLDFRARTHAFHVVFTPPAEQRFIVLAQREQRFTMMRAVSETLLTLAHDGSVRRPRLVLGRWRGVIVTAGTGA